MTKKTCIGKTKGDLAFEKKLDHLLHQRPLMIMGLAGLSRAVPLPLDTQSVEALFLQYGHYLELIDYTVPMSTEQTLVAASSSAALHS